ncbi:hypothetical protein ACLEPN_23815 [Myxococcus sp. 1LA]
MRSTKVSEANSRPVGLATSARGFRDLGAADTVGASASTDRDSTAWRRARSDSNDVIMDSLHSEKGTVVSGPGTQA